MIAYRHCAPNLAFLWEIPDQPAARWHRSGEGPVQYLADTPAGAWAEFIRHEEITELDDLSGVRRALWAVELPDDLDLRTPALPLADLLGGVDSYVACQQEAADIRASGADGVDAVSAALQPGAASGWTLDHGMHRTAPQDGRVFVLFGAQPQIRGWPVVRAGAPSVEVLAETRQFA